MDCLAKPDAAKYNQRCRQKAVTIIRRSVTIVRPSGLVASKRWAGTFGRPLDSSNRRPLPQPRACEDHANRVSRSMLARPSHILTPEIPSGILKATRGPNESDANRNKCQRGGPAVRLLLSYCCRFFSGFFPPPPPFPSLRINIRGQSSDAWPRRESADQPTDFVSHPTGQLRLGHQMGDRRRECLCRLVEVD